MGERGEGLEEGAEKCLFSQIIGADEFGLRRAVDLPTTFMSPCVAEFANHTSRRRSWWYTAPSSSGITPSRKFTTTSICGQKTEQVDYTTDYSYGWYQDIMLFDLG